MSRAFLRANAEVTLDEQAHVIERQCSDGVWVLKHKHTGRTTERTTDELYDAYAEGSLKFPPSELRGISAKSVRRQRVVSTNLAPEELAHAKVRLAYARAAAGVASSQPAIETVIDEVWETLDPRPAQKPGWVSVYRWTKAYLESGEDPSSLVADHEAKGNRGPRYPDDVLAICHEVLETVFLAPERPSLEHAVDIARAKVRRANQLASSAEQFPLPTRKLMQRLIAEIPAYDRHVARYGRESARKRFRNATKCRVTEAPLQRAEMDHTRMNVFVVDDDHGAPLGRPWLTILIDDHTRYVLGYCLSFEPPSRATVARCLRFAFMPKTKLRDEYPDLKNSWDGFGVVQELVLDGGTEFHSDELDQICFELNIEQHFSPRKTPWFKGKVERHLGTLNRSVCITMPGKTFEGILDRDDYDSKKHAVISESALKRVVVRWIVDVYHQKKHSALECSPAKMWASTVSPHDLALMQDPVRFDAIVGGRAKRRLSHKGIEYDGLHYNCGELGKLRRDLGDVLDVQIRFDRSNLGGIIVLHPERGTPYKVPCLRPDYAEGLTEWQHKVCKGYARKKLQESGDVDDWLDALLEISEIVEREMLAGKRKGKTRERIARWNQGRSATIEAMPPPTQPAQLPTVVPVVLPVVAPAAVSMAAPAPVAPTAPSVRRRFRPVFDERRATDLAKELNAAEVAND